MRHASERRIGQLDPDLWTREVLEFQAFSILALSQAQHRVDKHLGRSACSLVFADSKEIFVYFVREYNVLIRGVPRENILSASVPSQTAKKVKSSNAQLARYHARVVRAIKWSGFISDRRCFDKIKELDKRGRWIADSRKRLHDPVVNVMNVAFGCTYQGELLDDGKVEHWISRLHEGAYGAVEWTAGERAGGLCGGCIGVINVGDEFEPHGKLPQSTLAVVPFQGGEGGGLVCGVKHDPVQSTCVDDVMQKALCRSEPFILD